VAPRRTGSQAQCASARSNYSSARERREARQLALARKLLRVAPPAPEPEHTAPDSVTSVGAFMISHAIHFAHHGPRSANSARAARSCYGRNLFVVCTRITCELLMLECTL
jgi:hypothetical protein